MPIMDSGVLSAVVTRVWRGPPCAVTREMTCCLQFHNRNGEYTLWGNELEKYRTRIFERVDLMRDKSGYICDRSEIGPTSTTATCLFLCDLFEQLLSGFARHGPNLPAISASRRHGRVFLSWRRPPASHAITGSKEGGFYAGTSATDADAGNEVLSTGKPASFSFCWSWAWMTLWAVLSGNGTLYPAFAVSLSR